MPFPIRGFIVIFLVILMVLGGAVYYSYLNTEVEVANISFGRPPVKVNVTKAVMIGLSTLMGGGISFIDLVETIEGVNLVFYIMVKNSGLLPINIPIFRYELYLNDVYAGYGYTEESVSIVPGEEYILLVSHTIPAEKILEVAESVIKNEGTVEIHVIGEAPVSILGVTFTIDVETIQIVNIYDVIYEAVIDALSRADEIPGVGSGFEGQPGNLIVTGVYWLYNDEPVNQVPPNSDVKVLITLKAVGGPVEGNITIRVKKDLVLMPDETHIEYITNISLKAGESISIFVEFTTQESGIILRGYYIEIIWPNGTRWIMPDSYPPRLMIIEQ